MACPLEEKYTSAMVIAALHTSRDRNTRWICTPKMRNATVSQVVKFVKVNVNNISIYGKLNKGFDYSIIITLNSECCTIEHD